MQKIHSILGKMDTHWLADVRAILDTWHSHAVSLEEFQTAVYEKGLSHSKAAKGRAWIVDSSNAKGVFSNEIQNFIGTHIFPSFAKWGVKYFITVHPKDALAKLTVKKYTEKAGPNGIKLVETTSLEDALVFLKNNP
ncbi:MAG TPA: hypothetical protein VK470_14505 [Bacteroidota bacterium]|nr:hypothetical protein [Bacteroidota bacterium]